MDDNSRLWTYEAAYNALQESVRLSSHSIASLSSFLDKFSKQLAHCYDPISKPSSESLKKLETDGTKLHDGTTVGSLDKKLVEDAKELSKLVDIDELEALRIVLWFDRKGVLKDERRQLHYIRFYLSERRYNVKVVMDLFIGRATLNTEDDAAAEYEKVVRKHSTEILANPKFFTELIAYIKKIFTEPTKKFDDETIDELWVKETEQFKLVLLDFLLHSISTVIPLDSSDLLIQWFECCASTDYLSSVSDTALALIVLVSISFFDLEQEFGLDTASYNAYFTNPAVMTKIHDSISKLNHDDLSAVQLAYGVVLHRVSMRLESEPDSKFDGFAKHVAGEKGDVAQHAGEIVQRALHRHAIEKLAAIFNKKTLALTAEYSRISCSLLQSVLPYVTLNQTVASAIKSCMAPLKVLSDAFFANPFANRALMLTRAKVPIGILPFIKLSQALGESAFEYLYNMDTFMMEMARSFRDYEFVPGKPSSIQLTASLELYPSRDFDNAGGIVLEPGSTGEIISTGNSTVVMWSVKYNGWSFLGRVLEQSQILQLEEDEVVTETLELINSTLGHSSGDKVSDLLDSLSEGLRPGIDIVDLITKMLDEALYSRNLRLCVLGVDFLTALAKVVPAKVWPYLGRSKLLERNGRGGEMATILGAVEFVQTKYDFTISVLKLVNVLVRDAAATALDKTVSHKIKSESLAKFTRHFVDVYESFAYWRYADTRQRVEIASLVLSAFTEILYSRYRVDGELTSAVLKDPAQVITEQFLSTSDATLRTLQPLLGAIESVARSNLPLDVDNGLDLYELAHSDTSLKFCSLILRVRSLLKLPISLLEKRLFIHSPDLALIFLRYNALHSSVVDLLEAMISGYCHSEFDQPSLLAHLGTDYSQMLITGLANAIQNDLELDDTIRNICNYFSAILYSQQEGLSILLLSGKDTRNTSNKVESVDSLLQVIEQKVCTSHKQLLPELLEQILDCIALAHSNWNTSAKTAENKSKLVDTLIAIAGSGVSLKLDEAAQQDDVTLAATMYSCAAQAVKILSIELYKSPSQNLPKITSKLNEYSGKFLAITGFRGSLHGNLTRNFAKKYNVQLAKFVKSGLVNKKFYGESYLYDMWLLDILLDDDPAWEAGYKREVLEANVNLSLIDAQVTMVHAWCSLLTSVIRGVSKLDSSARTKVEADLVRIAVKAVEINAADDGIASAVPLFQPTFLRRLDLAFSVFYNVKERSVTAAELEMIFGLLVDPNVGFAENGASSSTKLYRQLLKILNLVLDGVKGSATDFSLHQTLHQILDVVVIRGMRSIVTSLTDTNKDKGTVDDIIQIISVLRKCLKFRGIEAVYPNLVLQMADSGTDRAVLALYSNCTETTSDAGAFGELALLYLIEWMQVDSMADQFVMSGIFGVLMQAPISKMIQTGGITAQAEPRLYGIWSNGILTAILVLLEKLGSPIVPEVIMFTNFFQAQLLSTLSSWLLDTASMEITLAAINETSQIVLLFDIVTRLCEADQVEQMQRTRLPSNVDLTESIEYLLTHQKYLATRLAITQADGSADQKQFREQPEKLMQRVVTGLEDLRELLAE